LDIKGWACERPQSSCSEPVRRCLVRRRKLWDYQEQVRTSNRVANDERKLWKSEIERNRRRKMSGSKKQGESDWQTETVVRHMINRGRQAGNGVIGQWARFAAGLHGQVGRGMWRWGGLWLLTWVFIILHHRGTVFQSWEWCVKSSLWCRYRMWESCEICLAKIGSAQLWLTFTPHTLYGFLTLISVCLYHTWLLTVLISWEKWLNPQFELICERKQTESVFCHCRLAGWCSAGTSGWAWSWCLLHVYSKILLGRRK